MAKDAAQYSRRIILSPSTVLDQAAIYNYTAEQWSDRQADEYADFLDAVILELSINPTIAPLVPTLDGVRCYVARWKGAHQGHRIFFEATESEIFVLRILHTAMNWPEYFD